MRSDHRNLGARPSDQALRPTRASPIKVELIESIPGDEPLRMYWHGHWQDLCRGPHLQHTGQLPADAFKLMSDRGGLLARRFQAIARCCSGSMAWAFTEQGKAQGASDTSLKKPKNAITASLGREMEPVPLSGRSPRPGVLAPQWLDHLYVRFEDYMRRKQDQAPAISRDQDTPQVVDRKLWEASGHWDKYP